MRATDILSIVLQALLLQSVDAAACNKRGSCNADNCARAATGTFDGKQSLRTSACSSFQQCTVIPPTTTITNVVSVTPAPVTDILAVTTITSVEVIPTTVTAGAGSIIPEKRNELYGGLNVVDKRGLTSAAAAGATTVCPTSVPSTASACSGTSRYASACSCAGFTRSYTTAPAPSTTVTITSVLNTPTETVPVVASTVVTSFDVATVTPVASPPTTAFHIQVAMSSGAPGSQYNGLFVTPDDSFGELSVRPQSVGGAINFELDNTSELVNQGSTGSPSDHVAVAVTIRNAVFVVWDTRQHYDDSQVTYPFTHCAAVPSVLAPGSYSLQCTAASGVLPAICDPTQWNSMGGGGIRPDPYIVFFQPGGSHIGCYNFEPVMVSVS